jgi:predicted O-linked N-acetylglucosamine transferase (SPINDLY family)
MSLVTQVRGLAGAVLSRENAVREEARQRYPKLLESDETDAKAVAEMQRVMELLGKSPSDLAADLAVLREYRRLQGVFEQGRGQARRDEELAKALEAQAAETSAILDARRIEHRNILVEQSVVGGRRGNADRAAHQLEAMRSQHPDLLMHETPVDRSILG